MAPVSRTQRRHIAVLGAFPEDLDIHTIPPEYKMEGSDWYAVFNPKVKRVLDVQLVHNLMHERCVCFKLSYKKWKFDSITASCVALGSRRMASTLPQDVTGLRRSTIPRRAPRLGEPHTHLVRFQLNHLTVF